MEEGREGGNEASRDLRLVGDESVSYVYGSSFSLL